MNRQTKLSVIAASVLVSMGLATGAHAAQGDSAAKMGFFVTSVGSGNGADLGGLAGADKLCQSLATAAGAGSRTWRAYLSTNASGSEKTVHARDRIGKGPWYNAKGVLIAKNLDELYTTPNLIKQTALTEKGTVVNGRGDTPNMHDILTGSDTHGRSFGGPSDTTCGNWTKSTPTGSAQVGHSDRTGLREDAAAKAWANSHPSRGCSQDALKSSGGDGRFYCFAAK